MKNNRLKFFLLVTLFTLVKASYAQVNLVEVFPTVQKFIGDVSELDRSKYFTIHTNANDSELQEFYSEYNVVRSGRGFYGPGADAKKQKGEVGFYPKSNKKSKKVKEVTRYIGTEHPKNVYKEGVDIEAFSNWAVQYYKGVDATQRPLWYEPMNEPFVHARDFYEEKDWDPVAELRVKTEMSHLFSAVAEKIHAEPTLENMRVVGFASAWPSFELKDFMNWETNMKLFLDIAGEHLDAISYHLYDGINQAGQDNKRSGSNNEAIMDLIETYSMYKWGKVKPHAITEYGGIEGQAFSIIKNMQSIRSQNSMIFGLLDREDRIEISIPFTVGKATWHITKVNDYLPYKAVLWRGQNAGVPKNEITGWVYTNRIHFYSLWKDVKGKRVLIKTDNPDVQVQAFVDGKKLFVALNNLDDLTQSVKLNMPNIGNPLKEVRFKSLTVFKEDHPYYHDDILDKAPIGVNLGFGETAILEYRFKNDIEFENQLKAIRYYSRNHLKPIHPNKEIIFKYNDVVIGSGFASLSLSMGRKHDVTKSPRVKVNGVPVEVPENWEGYDQANRKEFFGAIQIPVPMNLLKVNNIVSVTFPDKGGHLSTMILDVETFDLSRISKK